MGREEPRQLGAEAIQDAHDNESGNNAGESEAKNVAYMVSSNASPGLVRRQWDVVRMGVRNIAHRILLRRGVGGGNKDEARVAGLLFTRTEQHRRLANGGTGGTTSMPL